MGKREKSEYLFEDFAEIETEREYKRCHFSVRSAIIIVICGTFRRLKKMKEIHMWATIKKIREFLKECFAGEFISCYSWFTQVPGIIDPKSINEV